MTKASPSNPDRLPQRVSQAFQTDSASSPEQSPRQLLQLIRSTPGEGTSLRLRLLQTILPVVLVPLVLAGAAGYRVVQQRTQTRVQGQLEDQALLVSEGTTAVLDELLGLPRTIAASPLVINEAAAGSRQVEETGLDQRSDDELNAQFDETRLLRVHDRLNTYLKQTAETAGIFEISIAESHGFNVAYSQLTTDFVQRDEPWWQNGKKDGQWIGAPDYNHANRALTVELSQAIRDPSDDSFVGVVRAVLPARKFSLLAQYIKRTGISGSQRVQLIDGAERKVIDTLSPQGFRKMDVIGDQPIEQLIEAFVTATKTETNPQQILQALKENSSVQNLSIVFSDETATVASFTHQSRQYKMASIPNTQWVAIASMNTAEISAAGRDSLLFLVLITLLLGGLTSGLILWLARQLSSPLGSLADQAQLVAAGDFDIAVTPRGTRETRTLTRSFNQLVVQVKDLLQRQEIETQKAQLFASITGTTVTSLATLKPLLVETLPKAQKLLNADRVLFYPVDPERSGPLATEAVSPSFPATLEPPADSPPTEEALANPTLTDRIPATILSAQPNHSALAIDSVAAADLSPEHQAYLSALKVKSTLTMPVFNEDKLFGVLTAHSHTPHPWQPDERTFIAQLATHLELVIDRVTAIQKIQASRQVVETLSDEKRQQTAALSEKTAALSEKTAALSQQTATLSQQKDRLAQQSETLLRQNEQLRRTEAELSQQNEQLRRTEAELSQQSETLRLQNEAMLENQAQLLQSQEALRYQEEEQRLEKEEQRRQKEQLQQQIAWIVKDIEGVFKGDLTVRAQVAEGELKTVADVFNLTVERLQTLVRQVKQSSDQMTTFLGQNQEMAAYLSHTTYYQSQEATKTLETLKEMNASMDAIAQSANQAATTAQQVITAAKAGEAEIQFTAEQILRLNEVCTFAVSQIENLGGAARHIAQVSSMVREIATEIGLLSDQVKIEVSDSTEHYSLKSIAKEINKLSDRTLGETRLIDTFLKTLQQKTGQVSESIGQINAQVSNSTQLVQDSQQNLEAVAVVAGQFNELAQSIATTTLSHSQISHSVSDLVYGVVGLSEETATFSQKMEKDLYDTVETAQSLQNSVSIFKVGSPTFSPQAPDTQTPDSQAPDSQAADTQATDISMINTQLMD
ncbi:MAG: GAF domain-containing protein [Cyanobacteria bacterium P01_A01_bin.114]